MTAPRLGSLTWTPAALRPSSSPRPSRLPCRPGRPVWVAEIDDDLADTAAFLDAYAVPPEASANCVVVAARRAGQTTLAACVVPPPRGRTSTGWSAGTWTPEVLRAAGRRGRRVGHGLWRDHPGRAAVGLAGARRRRGRGRGLGRHQVGHAGQQPGRRAWLGAGRVAGRRGARGLGQPLPADGRTGTGATPTRAGAGRQRRRLGGTGRRRARRRLALSGGLAAALGQRSTQSRPGRSWCRRPTGPAWASTLL